MIFNDVMRVLKNRSAKRIIILELANHRRANHVLEVSTTQNEVQSVWESRVLAVSA